MVPLDGQVSPCTVHAGIHPHDLSYSIRWTWKINHVIIQVIHVDLVMSLILCPTIPKPTKDVIIHITILEVLPSGVSEHLHGV